MAIFYNKITTVILLFAIILTVKSFKITKVDKSFSPHWVSLCGHQYLFSEEITDWTNAREMCKLLGGYLVQIENLHENNCILLHAQNNGLHSWWWTSGTILT